MYEGLGILYNPSNSPPEKVFSEVGMEGFHTSPLFLSEKENKLNHHLKLTVLTVDFFFLIRFILRTP